MFINSIELQSNTPYMKISSTTQIKGFCFALPGASKSLLKSASSVLAICSGMALVASPAKGAISYSGIVNLSIPTTFDGIYLNVATGGFGYTDSTSGWDVNLYSGTGLGLWSPSNSLPSERVYASTSVNNIPNLTLGTEIGSGSTFSVSGEGSISQWSLNSTNNLVGFRFVNEENSNLVHYGWFRMGFGSSITAPERRIADYAYDTVAGESIQAGAIPEPSSFVLLLGAAAAATAYRRRTA
jgi:hypothetical protein